MTSSASPLPASDPPIGPARPFVMWPLIVLIVLCVVIELSLTAADYKLINAVRLRPSAYEYAGFWPGLMVGNWKANYGAQPYVMFFSYGFLHGGPMHLLVNMVTLWSLGRAVLMRVGVTGFTLLYFAAMIGGGIGFGLLSSDLRPMVGASGALFGLAGGLLAWNYVDRFTLHEGLWPVAQAALLLVAMNVVLWWVMDGQLAWETHLGGFVSGWVAALLIDPRGKV